MLRRIALAGLLALAPSLASAQFATIGPTPPTSDNGDRLATTAWVNNLIAGGLALPSGKIWIGSAGNIATAQTLTGDVTVSIGGVTTFATVNANVGTFGSATQCVTVTNNAKGLTTAVSAATCTPAIGSITGLGAGIATFLATPSSANLAAAVTGGTGTGALVFGTSPNITTPTGIVKGDVGLSNVANVDTTNATNISSGTLAVARGGAAASNIPAVATTGNACASCIGAQLSNSAGILTMVTGTPQNAGTVNVPAGDWDLFCGFTASGSGAPTVTEVWISINNVSATPVFLPLQSYRMRGFSLSDPLLGGGAGPFRVTQASSNNYYCVAQAAFSGGTGFSITGTLVMRRPQ